jgi:ABC-type sugar transport system ATPase subunit
MLEIGGIVKDFGGTRALDQVSFAVRPGEVHALVGENGAGKSTLGNVICGALKPEAGTIHLDGRPLELKSPLDAAEAGISIVHQHFSLVPELTVAENIFLGRVPKTRLGFVDWKKLFVRAEELLERLDFRLDAKRPVKSLGAAGRQMTEITRALSLASRILIMDEPSAVLSPGELERLFGIIGRLKADGKTIIYISHRLAEIFEIGDRVTVLKDGKGVGTYELDGRIDPPFLISKMVGRQWADHFPEKSREVGRELLRVEDLRRHGAFENVSFTLRAGEIVGLAGLVGSGRTELLKAIFGALPPDEGRIYVEGKCVRIGSPRDALAHGIAYLSEDRHHEGVIPSLSVGMNMTLPVLHRFAPRGILRLREEKRFVDEMIEKLDVRTRGRNQLVSRLSGGNQQKVALAKWLATEAKVFLFDEPTAGIDVGSKREIYRLIAELAESGRAVLMVSSEIPEVLSMSQRILVMNKGRISGRLSAETTSEEDVLRHAT